MSGLHLAMKMPRNAAKFGKTEHIPFKLKMALAVYGIKSGKIRFVGERRAIQRQSSHSSRTISSLDSVHMHDETNGFRVEPMLMENGNERKSVKSSQLSQAQTVSQRSTGFDSQNAGPSIDASSQAVNQNSTDYINTSASDLHNQFHILEEISSVKISDVSEFSPLSFGNVNASNSYGSPSEVSKLSNPAIRNLMGVFEELRAARKVLEEDSSKFDSAVDDDDCVPETPPPSTPEAVRRSPQLQQAICSPVAVSAKSEETKPTVSDVSETQTLSTPPSTPKAHQKMSSSEEKPFAKKKRVSFQSPLPMRSPFLRTSPRLNAKREDVSPSKSMAGSKKIPVISKAAKVLKTANTVNPKKSAAEKRRMKAERSSPDFWVGLIKIQVRWLRKLCSDKFSRAEVIVFLLDCWEILRESFTELLRVRSKELQDFMLKFLANAIKLYEVLTSRGYYEVFTMLAKYVRTVLRKFLFFPKQLSDHNQRWIQAREACPKLYPEDRGRILMSMAGNQRHLHFQTINMICQHVAQPELIMPTIRTITELQMRFITLWTSSNRKPEGMDAVTIHYGIAQLTSFISSLNNRLQQANNVKEYGICF